MTENASNSFSRKKKEKLGGLHVATLDGNNWLKLFVLKVKNDHLQLSPTAAVHI